MHQLENTTQTEAHAEADNAAFWLVTPKLALAVQQASG